MPMPPLPTCRAGASLLAVVVLLAACDPGSTDAPASPEGPRLAVGRTPSPTDPTATFFVESTGKITGESAVYLSTDPVTSASAYRYAYGECGVNAKIFATTEKSGSGDAIMHTDNPRFSNAKCREYPRKLRFVLDQPVGAPAPVTEFTSTVFVSVPKLHPAVPGTGLPVVGTAGAWQPWNVSFGMLGSGPCGSIRFDGTAGTDQAEVRRVAADLWEVRAVAPAARGLCQQLGLTFQLPFHITIRSSYALPTP